jgi:hypothetical protein
MSTLRIDVGFLPALKGSDSVLLNGEPDALRLLANPFIEVGKEGLATVALGELPWVAEHSIRLQLCTGNTDEGMAGQAPNFQWRCKSSTWSSFAEKRLAWPRQSAAMCAWIRPTSGSGLWPHAMSTKTCSLMRRVPPSTSFNRSANGWPPGPRGALVHHAPRGPGVHPSSPG